MRVLQNSLEKALRLNNLPAVAQLGAHWHASHITISALSRSCACGSDSFICRLLIWVATSGYILATNANDLVSQHHRADKIKLQRWWPTCDGVILAPHATVTRQSADLILSDPAFSTVALIHKYCQSVLFCQSLFCTQPGAWQWGTATDFLMKHVLLSLRLWSVKERVLRDPLGLSFNETLVSFAYIAIGKESLVCLRGRHLLLCGHLGRWWAFTKLDLGIFGFGLVGDCVFFQMKDWWVYQGETIVFSCYCLVFCYFYTYSGTSKVKEFFFPQKNRTSTVFSAL